MPLGRTSTTVAAIVNWILSRVCRSDSCVFWLVSCAILFDSVSALMGKGGDVLYFLLWMAQLMLMTQMGVRTLLTHNETDPVHFMDVLNRTIYDNLQRMEIDKNLTLALLDYVAHPHNGGGQLKASELVNTLDLGFPIGLDDDIASFVNQITLELQPGDGVVLYTDGITEAENIAGEQYGMEQLCAVISRHWAESADVINAAVIYELRQFIGAQTVFDDITLLVLKQK